MIDNILKGKWKELKGDAKRRWGKLTDDDLTQIEGNAEKLRGTLEKRYGYSKDDARRELDEFIRDIRATGDDEQRREAST